MPYEVLQGKEQVHLPPAEVTYFLFQKATVVRRLKKNEQRVWMTPQDCKHDADNKQTSKEPTTKLQCLPLSYL